MATFEITTINNVPYLHIHCSTEEVASLITNPFAFFQQAEEPEVRSLLQPDRPVTMGVFYWQEESNVPSEPNVCAGGGDPSIKINGPGTACVCISLGVISSANHMQIYFNGPGE